MSRINLKHLKFNLNFFNVWFIIFYIINRKGSAVMSDDHQKKIFSNNLSYFLNVNGIQQKALADYLGVSPSTVNMWIKANSMPSVSTIQKIADRLGIGKSDLVDPPKNAPEIDAKIMCDERTMEMARKFIYLTDSDKSAIEHIVNSLYKKRTED